MSTLGDPRTDLGWMLSYWRDPKDPEPSVVLRDGDRGHVVVSVVEPL